VSQGRIPAWEIPREFWPQEFFGGMAARMPFFLESNPARIWNLDLRPNTLVATVVMPGKIGWICFLSSLSEAGAAFQRPCDCDDFWQATLAWFQAQGSRAVQFLSEVLQPGNAETTGARIRLPKTFRYICDFQDLEWSPNSAAGKAIASHQDKFVASHPETIGRSPAGATPAPAPLSGWKILKGEPAGQESALAIATMEQSGDCPELAEIRSNTAAWESLLQVHGRTKECWTLQIAGLPAGILLGYLPEGEKEGLVSYLGLVPEVRGKGWGKLFLREFLEESLKRDSRLAPSIASGGQVATMVDVRNKAAWRLYHSLGFRKRSQGKFHLAFLQPLSSK
jgi:ribosomal protein S18 acetylase RimI-like enzyme